MFLFLSGLSVFDAYAFVVLVLRAPRLRLVQFTPAQKIVLRLLAITLLLSNWINELYQTTPFEIERIGMD